MLRSPERDSTSRASIRPSRARPQPTRTVLASTNLVVAAALAAGAVCEAQNPNFITPGVSHRTAPVPNRETFDARIEDSPWEAGIFHFSPWIGIRDASVVTSTNVGDGSGTTDDFTISAGAGLRGYVRSGPKVMIAGHLLPEYTWWAEDPDRRRVNGRYGLGLFGHFNRLELELSHRLLEEQTFFSSEVQRLTPTRTELTRAIFDIEIGPRVLLTLRATRTRATNVEDDGELTGFLSQLDRTEDTYQALIGYRAPGGWRFGVGYEGTTVDFDDGARPLSNDVEAILVESSFAGNRFDGALEVAFRDLEPGADSGVRPASEVTGVLEGIWGLTARSAVLTYFRRTLTYSIDSSSSYFIGDRVGVRWQTAFNRFGLGLFGETGEDRFVSLAGSTLDRTDDVTSFGAEASLAIKSTRLSLHVRTTDYRSPVDTFDRDVTTFGLSVQIDALERLVSSAAERLRVGDAGGTW